PHGAGALPPAGPLARLYAPEDLVPEVWAVDCLRLRELEPRDGRITPVPCRFLASILRRKSSTSSAGTWRGGRARSCTTPWPCPRRRPVPSPGHWRRNARKRSHGHLPFSAAWAERSSCCAASRDTRSVPAVACERCSRSRCSTSWSAPSRRQVPPLTTPRDALTATGGTRTRDLPPRRVWSAPDECRRAAGGQVRPPSRVDPARGRRRARVRRA